VPAISKSIRRILVDPKPMNKSMLLPYPINSDPNNCRTEVPVIYEDGDQHGTSNHQPSNSPDKLAPAESPEPITQQMTDELLTKGRFTHPAMHVSCCCCCSRCTSIRSVCWPARHAPIRPYHHRHTHTPTDQPLYF
jgi:hypothetical protein